MILHSNFLPCLAYFVALLDQETINIDINTQYRKQNYYNRAYILGANKVEPIIVPVIKSPNNSVIKNIKIDYCENWNVKSWRTIESAYKNTPFFQYYDYLFKPHFEKKYIYLIDLNYNLLTICLKALNLAKPICHLENQYFEIPNQLISFNAKNRTEDSVFYKETPYKQNFGNVFESNLSIIDLIFNKGPESIGILTKSNVNLF